MKPRTQKIVMAALFGLVLAAIVIGMVALTSNTDLVGHSGRVSGHSGRHHQVAIVNLPPVATTTTAVIPATTPSTSRPVVPVTVQPKVVVTTTTTSAPAKATTPAPVVTTATTAPPKVGGPTASIVASAQIITTGTMTAPDGSGCVADAQAECILLRATVTVNTRLTNLPPAGALVFGIYDNAGNVIGTLTNRAGGGSSGIAYCVLEWSDRTGTFDAGSSPDCSGTPIMSSSVISGFQYSATFTYVDQPSATTGELYY